jgi:ATP-dependent helicase HrpA
MTAEPAAGAATRIDDLRLRLAESTVRDRRRLSSWLDRIARIRGPAAQRETQRFESQLAASIARVAARRETVPAIRYDQVLPVHQRREEIAAAIARSPVVVVSGSTGCGKSTQLPKICLEMGRGVQGMIGHTQPRRIAAQSLATRIANELTTNVGELVGYQVRFVDRTSPRTLVKLMTDGVLLREIESDPLLEKYDTLIIDEAHERNLNVDFLLGVCKRLVQRRPELRVIVTSATIETERFAQFFGEVPVIDVEGRSYPVEVRYRPLHEEDAEAPSEQEAIGAALEELASEPGPATGDALVFLAGEKQIHEARDHLQRTAADQWEILPLYARLSSADQDRIFAPHARRRAILATNVAETSLTIPGVRYVVDTGLARISRYSPRAKFQRLPVEAISRASADQRKGRCGREDEGICIRLYAEDDYVARPQYTDPEIRRTNLASLILQMAALGLGAPEDFPFLDPPDARLLNDGYRLLLELGAVDGERRITRLGRQMAALPVDPRLARILVEAGHTRCLTEALVITAFLSIPDPRERPADKTEAADERHAVFADERSDFVTILNLWKAFREQSTAGGTRALRRWCRDNFLSFLRIRDWQDLHDQLVEITATQNFRANPEPAPAAALHQAILSGFLGGIGVLDQDRTYLGARDARFVIAPGTPLRKRSPHWIVAASLVETDRLYARTVAQVQPSWIEAAGGHLVRRTYGEVEWLPERGMAVASETVSLYGRILRAGRKVNYAIVDPQAARRIFIEEALVRGQSALRFDFLERNARARAGIEYLETKLRRHDLLVDESTLVQFFLERIPQQVTSTRSFDRWWRQEEAERPDFFDLSSSMLLRPGAPSVDAADYPDTFTVEGNELRIRYRFDPASDADGATLVVPLPLLDVLPAGRLEWFVPGWIREKVVALLRGLPKAQRRLLVPIPESAERFLQSHAQRHDESLMELLAAFVTRESGEATTAADLRAIAMAPYLHLNFSLVDAMGRELRQGRDLAALRSELRGHATSQVGRPAHAWERESVRRWDFGEIPGEISVQSHGLRLRMYPGLEDAGTSVRLRLYARQVAAQRHTREAVVRLAALAMPQQYDKVRRTLSADRDIALLAASSGLGKSLFDEVADRAVEVAVLGHGPVPHAEREFLAAVDAGRARVVEASEEIARSVKAILQALKEAKAVIARLDAPVFASARSSVQQQLARLTAPGFVRRTPQPWFGQLAKYLRALTRRLDRLKDNVERDPRLQAQVEPYERLLAELEGVVDPAEAWPELEKLRWMIEEFRVSLFAQELRTLMPISAKRLEAQAALARREAGKE